MGIEEYIPLGTVLLLDTHILDTVTLYIYYKYTSMNDLPPFPGAGSCYRAHELVLRYVFARVLE